MFFLLYDELYNVEVNVLSKMGRPKLENPANHFVNIRMNDERFKRLKAYAEYSKKTMTEVVVAAVDEYIDKKESESKNNA